MKCFITFLLEYPLYEHKEWHQFVKHHGNKILDKMGHKDQYSALQGEPDHGSPAHMTEYIKKNLGLSDVPKEHGRWIIDRIQKGKIENLEDVQSTIIPNLQKFQETQHVHGVNLKQVNNPAELFNLVSKHTDDDRDQRFGITPGTDYHVLGENEHWTVVRPHTKKAACSFGKGTNWCTASESNNAFDNYNQHGPMHIFIPKKPKYKGEKYQYHHFTGQFMDHTDTRIHSPDIGNRGPNFHERPLPKEAEEGSEEILHARFHDTFAFGNREAGLEALKHPKLSNLTPAILSGNKEVAMAATKHPEFKKRKQYVTDALNSEHPEVALAATKHPEFGAVSLPRDRAWENDLLSGLTSKHKNVALATVRHPGFHAALPYEHVLIDRIGKSKHPEVDLEIIKQPTFGQNARHFRGALSSPHKEVALAAAKHPEFGSDYHDFEQTLRSDDKEVAMTAVQHPKFNASHIPLALHSLHKDVAMTAVQHPNFNQFFANALNSSHKEVAMAAFQHPEFGSDSRLMNNALSSRHKDVAMAAVQHPKFGSDSFHIQAALTSPHKDVAVAAVQHPNFNSDPTHINQALYSRHKEVAMAAMQHPEFGSHPHHFQYPFRGYHKEVAMAAVQHPKFNSDPTHMDKALNSAYGEVRMAALEHPNFGAEHINKALNSPYRDVAMTAVQHPKFGSHPHHFERAIYSRHKDVAMVAIEHPKFNKHPEHISRIIGQEGTILHLPRLPESIKDALVAKHNEITGGKQNNLENYQMKSFTQLLSERRLI